MGADRDLGTLQDAIVGAFVSGKQLMEFAQRRIDASLGSKVSSEGPTASVAFSLVQQVSAEGRVEQLVRALRIERSTNPKIIDLLNRFEATTAVPDEASRAELSQELVNLIKVWSVAAIEPRKIAKEKLEEIRTKLRIGREELGAGEVLGAEPQFLLREKVDDDGLIAVWKALDFLNDWKVVALKVIQDSTQIGRHKDALKVAKSFPDAFVELVAWPSVYADTFPFYVTEWAEQGTLWDATVQRKELLLLAKAFDLLGGIGRNLAALHASQKVHGSVTPRHVLLRARAGGVSACLAEAYASRSSDVAMCLAPELLGDALHPTPASDQYGLAMTILFVVLARPSVGPGDVGEVRFDALRSLLERATSQDPAKRYGNMLAFCEAFDAARTQISAQAMLRPSDFVAVHDALLALPADPPDDRPAFRLALITRLGLDERQLRAVGVDSTVRSPAQQWACFVRDVVALCRDRLGELSTAIDELKPGLASATAKAAAGTSGGMVRTVTISIPSFYWRLCNASEGTLESLALRLGCWEVVTPDATTPTKRACVLLLSALRKFTLAEVSAQLDALERQDERPDALSKSLLRQYSAPWLHEQLTFAVERVVKAIEQSDPAESRRLPEEMQRLQEFVAARDYAWLQAESGGVWRGIVRYFRRRKIDLPLELFEGFDHVDGAARRLSTITRDSGRLRSSTPEATRGLYQALLALPQDLLDRVSEGCDVEAWAVPSYDAGLAWRALHVAAFCVAWLPQDRPWTVVWNRLESFVRDQLKAEGEPLATALRTGNPVEIQRACKAFEVRDGDPEPRARVWSLLQNVASASLRPALTGQGESLEGTPAFLLGTIPDLHFAEVCLYLGESIQVADRDLRAAQWVDTHGPFQDTTSRLSRALTFVHDDLPNWALGRSPSAVPGDNPTERDAVVAEMNKLSPAAFDVLCDRLGVARTRMPHPLAPPALRTASLLGYCQALPDGIRMLRRQIAAINSDALEPEETANAAPPEIAYLMS